jgi:hypothetical protein
MALLTSQARFLAFFSEGQIGSPVSATPLGECNAITNGDLPIVTVDPGCPSCDMDERRRSTGRDSRRG